MSEEKSIKHKSFAVASLNKVNHHPAPLFGSSINHSNTIVLTISDGELIEDRDGVDRYFRGKDKIQIEMSNSQFSELISSFNTYSGVPVTLKYTKEDGYIEMPQLKSKKEKFSEAMGNNLVDTRNRVNKLVKTIENIGEDGKSKYLSKSDKENLISELTIIKNALVSGTDFINNRFNEQMEKTVTEAKMEVEAFINNRISERASELGSTNFGIGINGGESRELL